MKQRDSLLRWPGIKTLQCLCLFMCLYTLWQMRFVFSGLRHKSPMSSQQYVTQTPSRRAWAEDWRRWTLYDGQESRKILGTQDNSVMFTVGKHFSKDITHNDILFICDLLVSRYSLSVGFFPSCFNDSEGAILNELYYRLSAGVLTCVCRL